MGILLLSQFRGKKALGGFHYCDMFLAEHGSYLHDHQRRGLYTGTRDGTIFMYVP